MAQSDAVTVPTPKLFSRAQYELLMDAERKLRETKPLLEKAGKCGIECEAYHTLVDDRLAKIEALKTEFMNPPPKR